MTVGGEAGGDAKRRRVAGGGGPGPAPTSATVGTAGAGAAGGAGAGVTGEELRAGLEEALGALGAKLEQHRDVWEGARGEEMGGKGGGGGMLLGLAHRLGYTTFAPPGFIPGDPRWGALGPHVAPLGTGQTTAFRFCTPPAPQAWHIGASLLYEYAEDVSAAPLGAGAADGAPDGAGEVGGGATVWKEGDNLPEGLPPMPEGWQPGMPLPGAKETGANGNGGEAVAAVPVATADDTSAAAPTAPAAPTATTAGLPDALKLPATMGFILNPDLEDAEEEESSEEEISDED